MPYLRPLSLVSGLTHLGGHEPAHLEARPPLANLLIRNTFLVLRLVLIALFFHFAILELIFAIWNVHATLEIGLSAPSAAIFIIFQSCLVFGGVAMALVEMLYPRLKMSRTLWECSWVGLLSVFHMGSALGSLIGDSESDCQLTGDRNICVSASLLVPVTWFNTVFLLTYFLALFIATVVHKSVYPDIWKRTVYSVQWFNDAAPAVPPKEKKMKDFFGKKVFDDDDVYAAFYNDDIEASSRVKYSPRQVDEPAPWAVPGRRGIDPPFSSQPAKPWNRPISPTTTDATLALPAFPSRSAGPMGTNSGSRFVEKFRESSVLSRSEDPSEYSKHYHSRTNSAALSTIPGLTLDFDKPIPLTRMSEWMKAEDVQKSTQHHGLLFAP